MKEINSDNFDTIADSVLLVTESLLTSGTAFSIYDITRIIRGMYPDINIPHTSIWLMCRLLFRLSNRSNPSQCVVARSTGKYDVFTLQMYAGARYDEESMRSHLPKIVQSFSSLSSSLQIIKILNNDHDDDDHDDDSAELDQRSVDDNDDEAYFYKTISDYGRITVPKILTSMLGVSPSRGTVVGIQQDESTVNFYYYKGDAQEQGSDGPFYTADKYGNFHFRTAQYGWKPGNRVELYFDKDQGCVVCNRL